MGLPSYLPKFALSLPAAVGTMATGWMRVTLVLLRQSCASRRIDYA